MTAPRTRGSVLVFTLWLTAGLAAGALVFGHTALLRYRAEGAQVAELQADAACDGALRYVVAVLATTTPGTLPDAATYAAADLAVGDARVWLLGAGAELDAATPVFALQDEGAKLNLNTATLEMLAALPGMTPELAAAIVDWRDSDSDLTANGAESATYLARDPPYTAKDAPFETVDELRLLHGAAAGLLDGRDRNRNGLVEAWERTLAEQVHERFADVPDLGLLALVTVYSREPNTQADGSARVNLNDSAPAVRQALTAAFGERGATIAAAAGVGTRPFSSVLEFCVRGQVNDSEASVALDRFTVTPAPVLPGRVNINTASAAVLACLPGVGPDLAVQLARYRAQNSERLSSPLWVVNALGPDAAIAAGPYLTTRSFQVTADLVAVAPRGRGFRRVCYVLDTMSGTPVTIARRELTHLGWPLGAELYAQVRSTNGEGRP